MKKEAAGQSHDGRVERRSEATREQLRSHRIQRVVSEPMSSERKEPEVTSRVKPRPATSDMSSGGDRGPGMTDQI